MENIEFDFEKIMQMQLDKLILNECTKLIGAEFSDSTKANAVKDILMVFINRGIPLNIALDITREICDIILKSGGEDKNG